MSFNSRTPKGCDTSVRGASPLRRCFNSRTPKGCDQPNQPNHYGRIVSIHAPLKGATMGWLLLPLPLRRFNSRTPKGCDQGQGQRQKGGQGFNSRTPKGCDDGVTGLHDERRVSIHAPLKGATLHIWHFITFAEVSIHAPLKGATPLSDEMIRDELTFQFTHP